MKKNILILALVLSGLNVVEAQDTLAPSEAIQIGLENHFDIRLVRLDAQIAENNLSLGNAGFLPRIDLNAGQNFSVTDSKQEFLSGTVNDRKGARSSALNAGAQLNWTLFDGLQMFIGYDRLQEMQQKSELQLLLTVEYAVQQILGQYYQLVNLKQQLRVLEKTIILDQERLQLAENMLAIGSGSRLDLLQAQVDLNADSAALLGLLDRQQQTKALLNQLLARDARTLFEVADTFNLRHDLVFDQLAASMMERNTSLGLAQNDERQSLLLLREIRGRQLPSLGFTMGYNFLNQQSESGFISSNRSSGMTYGLQANMSLFDGFNTQREKRNANILIQSSRIRTESLISELNNELTRHFDSHNSKMRLLSMERQNLMAASENLNIASERYRIGDLSGIEFREAQKNYMVAEGRLLQTILETKLVELQLLQLAGMLATEQ
jgi:outer membrane protein TolC